MTLARRIAVERRALIVPLVVALLVNIGIYLLAVYPLSAKVRSVERRALAVERDLQAAQRESAVAAATLTGKDRADKDLATFYQRVLPADLSMARRITYLRLAQLARDANLKYQRRRVEPEPTHDSPLSKLRITMDFEGQYESVRQFIYRLETAPEFVIIDDVTLAQGSEPNAPLVLRLELSTYFRTGADGT